MTDYIVPFLLLAAALWSLKRKENTYDLLLSGGREGLQLAVSLLPTLVFLLTAVHMLRASGAMALLSAPLAPLFPFSVFLRKPPCWC